MLIFSSLMIVTSLIKTETRIIEKNIFLLKKEIAKTEDNLHEVQLDYYYLSSPEVIVKSIRSFSNQEYVTMDYSNIYENFQQFLNEKKKTTKFINNEKKIKKK